MWPSKPPTPCTWPWPRPPLRLWPWVNPIPEPEPDPDPELIPELELEFGKTLGREDTGYPVLSSSRSRSLCPPPSLEFVELHRGRFDLLLVLVLILFSGEPINLKYHQNVYINIMSIIISCTILLIWIKIFLNKTIKSKKYTREKKWKIHK